MNNLIFYYNENPVTFQNENGVMINATQMAKPFGRLAKDWLVNQQTEEFLHSLSAVRGIPLTELVKVRQGGNPQLQGTWMHEDVALEFARWLSPAFAIWTNDRIKELLTRGVATVSDDDETIANAMLILQKRLDASKQRNQILEGENAHYKEEIKQLAPKAAYTDEVLQSTSTFTVNQIAKDLGTGAPTLNKLLNQWGVQYKQSGQWLLYHKYQGKGLTDMRVFKYIDHRGDVKTSQSMVWTERGRKFIIELFDKQTEINTQIAKGAAV